MTNLELEKQLMTYADSITAFSWVQAVGFCFALAKGDLCKTVLTVDGAVASVIGIVLASALYALLVFNCAKAARSLDVTSGHAVTTLGSIQSIRIGIILAGGGLSILALCLRMYGVMTLHAC